MVISPESTSVTRVPPGTTYEYLIFGHFPKINIRIGILNGQLRSLIYSYSMVLDLVVQHVEYDNS